MTPEQKMWTQIKKLMGNYWHATRHEDLAGKGIPDVSFGADGVSGWLELKVLKAWPKKADTIISLEHFTKEQKNFLFSRGQLSGHCFLVLKVEESNDWLFFDHRQARELGTLKKHEMFALSNVHVGSMPSRDEFLDIIKGES